MDRKQYRAILSFTANLPSNAKITSVTLKIKKAGLTGANPFKSLGVIRVDVKSGGFGTKSALQTADFNTKASLTNVASIKNTSVGGWYSVTLPSTSYNVINKSGVTQFRLYFAKDDNNNGAADYLRFYSGNATATSQPQLVIKYYIP